MSQGQAARVEAAAQSGEAIEGVGFGARAAAFFIDVIYLLLLSLLVAALDGVALGLVGVARGRALALDERALAVFNPLGGLSLLTLYFVLPEWLYGATPGKKRLRMRVVRTDGAPCGPGAALVRALLRLVDGAFFGLVAYAAMRPPRYQRLGDRAARTVVVRADSPAVQPPAPQWRYAASLAPVVLLGACATMAFLLALALR